MSYIALQTCIDCGAWWTCRWLGGTKTRGFCGACRKRLRRAGEADPTSNSLMLHRLIGLRGQEV